jgi:gliding motility-associated-like protein
VLDNRFFTVQNGKFIWNSTENVQAKTSYQVAIRSIDRMGNEIDRHFTLMVERTGLEEIEIFNTFTPDGDGVNDTWGVPDLQSVRDAKVSIYDRSGRLVFQTNDASVRWDGTHLGKVLPTGTYFYVLESSFPGDVRRGTLNLLRK